MLCICKFFRREITSIFCDNIKFRNKITCSPYAAAQVLAKLPFALHRGLRRAPPTGRHRFLRLGGQLRMLQQRSKRCNTGPWFVSLSGAPIQSLEEAASPLNVETDRSLNLRPGARRWRLSHRLSTIANHAAISSCAGRKQHGVSVPAERLSGRVLDLL